MLLPDQDLASGSANAVKLGGRNTDHSAWAKHEAILQYEKFMKSAFQIDIENTVIDTIEKTSLGVEADGHSDGYPDGYFGGF